MGETLGAVAAAVAGTPPPSPIIARSTAVPFESVLRRVPAAAKSEGFGVLNDLDLREKMLLGGVPFERECHVFDVCQPARAARVLGHSMEISSVMPCRISVYEAEGRTHLAAVRPTVLLLGIFEQPDLTAEAAAVEEAVTRIMDVAADEEDARFF